MNDYKLPFSKGEIENITKEYNTPFYIYDEEGIRNCVKLINKAFSWNKGYKEYFAVKATPNPTILKILKDMGAGLDCASTAELIMAKKLGFGDDEIMFTSNNTPAGDYVLAKELGAIINLDDESHIDFLKDNCGIPEKICMRYNPGNDFLVQNQIMGTLQESKFGMRKDQILNSINRLKKLGTKHFGVHAMLASCALDTDYYPTLAAEVFNLALEIKKETGVSLEFINMSGGIGIPYRPEETAVDIEEVGMRVHKVYDELLTSNGMEPAIFTEMGRFITGPYGYLITRIVHQKESHKNYLGVDATACNLMRPAIYGAYHHITILGKENELEEKVYDVTGNLCENNDKFAINRKLPKAEIGDIICIHSAGAHGYSMGYNYNGRLKSAELLLQLDGTVKLIRRAETIDDYFRTLDIYPEFKEKY